MVQVNGNFIDDVTKEIGNTHYTLRNCCFIISVVVVTSRGQGVHENVQKGEMHGLTASKCCYL